MGLLLSVVAQSKSYDVVVYGATSAGVTAAIQSAKMNKKVLLVSTSRHIGGLTSSGLGATDINQHTVIGGLSREFYQRIYSYYAKPKAWSSQTPSEYFDNTLGKFFWKGRSDILKMQWMFEPHVAQKVYKEMLTEAKVEIVYNKRLDLKDGVSKKGTAIQSIKMEGGDILVAKMFIDATYEGDLMAKAGVSYTIGRESNQQYGESFNGILYDKLFGGGSKSVDPYLHEGDPTSGLLPFIEPKTPGVNGEGDHRVQAYCYRFTLSKDPKNKLPIKKPKNYNPLWFELYGRMCSMSPKIGMDKLFTLTPLPNKKTDTNHADFIGASYSWSEATYKQRDSIAQMHKDYALGKLWFIANDLRVPERIRTEIKRYGLAKDEFKNNENFPYQIYIREARRMVSDYVMTEHNVTRKVLAPESIAVGTYWLDSHVVSHFVDEKGQLWRDGAFWKGENIYPIAYKSIIPKANECSNLLVPVCLSSTHAAYGSIRMEPVYMVLGQSAATAACIAIDANVEVQNVSYKLLEKRLLADKQILQKP